MGNIWSIKSALRFLGATVEVSEDPSKVSRANALILPGVGSFRKAMEALRKKDLDYAIKEAVISRSCPILGICLGMQLLAENGTEDVQTSGLGFIQGTVIRFPSQESTPLKIPHIGFNSVTSDPDSRLFEGLPSSSDFYFVHSYHLPLLKQTGHQATCHYGEKFLAAFEKDNVFATQFHPEKSQTNGLWVLKNFLANCPW